MWLDALEWVGTLANLLYVLFMIRRNMWAWPAGVIGCLVFGVWFGWQHFYASMGLNGIYFVQTLYGWWKWAHTRNDPASQKPEQPVRNLPLQGYLQGLGIALVLTAAIYFLLRFTEEPKSPLMDAFLTALSIVGYQLTIQRYLDHWLVWLFVDILYTGLMIYHQSWLMAGVFALFSILAVRGYLDWRSAWKKQMAY